MTRLSPAEADVIANLQNARAPLTARIEEWCAVNSGSRNLHGLADMAARLSSVFAPLGTVALRDPAPVEAVGADGISRPLVHGQNLHVSHPNPGSTCRVLLTGHMDTVFASDHPFQFSRWLDADTLNGPGTADMKAGIAVMLAALMAVTASPFADRLAWEVVINSDEEVSSLGSAALLADCAKRADVGLTYEPALPDGTLAGARKGSGNFSAVVTGRAAHAGREPEKGRNAIVAAADLTLRLAALVRDGLSVNVAKVDGGGPNNIVPDMAVVRFNVRPSTLADQAAAEAAIADVAAAIAAQHQVAVDLHGSFARPPKPMDANQRRLFDLVKDCGADLGLPIGWRDTGGVCDGNNLAAHGLPVVDTLGPRGGAIHSADEFLCVDSLVERAQLSALILMRLAQGQAAGMSWFVRPARESDLDAYHAFALMTGGGFTNLPQNRDALAERLAWSARSFAADIAAPENELYVLILEEAGTGRIGGTSAIFSRVGATFPFYSYKLGRVSQSSRELERTFTSEVLHLVNDYDGSSEVGGLFLHPEVRGGGVGRLLARSRYLFMAQHRQRFGSRVLAELRGWLAPDGGSPFWDGLGAKFFGMPFQEADRFNGVHGNQFIADLMPKHPIYVSMLPDESRAIIGKPHDTGRPALSMLEEEGFAFDGYVDIFDGGPTVCARVDNVRSIRDSRSGPVAALVDQPGLPRALLATGELMEFRAWHGHTEWRGAGLALPRAEAELHGLNIGDTVRHVV